MRIPSARSVFDLGFVVMEIPKSLQAEDDLKLD
jgi:hypothetical protein